MIRVWSFSANDLIDVMVCEISPLSNVPRAKRPTFHVRVTPKERHELVKPAVIIRETASFSAIHECVMDLRLASVGVWKPFGTRSSSRERAYRGFEGAGDILKRPCLAFPRVDFWSGLSCASG